MENTSLILKIQKTKNNNFISLLNFKGKLILKESTEQKLSKNLKVIYTQKILSILEIIKDWEIQYIYLYINNLPIPFIKHTFNLLKSWNLNICFFHCNTKKPHNGCRFSHKSRKRRNFYKKKEKSFQKKNYLTKKLEA